MRSRSLGVLALLPVVALAACGGDDSGNPPDGISVVDATTTLPTDTTAVATDSTLPGTEPLDSSSSTAAPTTAAPATSAPSGLWSPVAPPELSPSGSGATAPIDPAWIESNGETLGTDVADGVYWGVLVGALEGVGGQGLSFDLSQAFFGQACIDQFGTGDDACLNDYGVLDDPHGEFPAWVDDLQYVSVADGIDPSVSYLIDGAELYQIVSGGTASPGAPDYWGLFPFPYFVTVQDGVVISLEQLWLP